MKKSSKLVKKIIEGIQEKKGQDIVVADLSGITETECDSLIICQGNTPTQVDAIVNSIAEVVLKSLGEKPVGVDGMQMREWVALDYVDTVAHVFVPEKREFYNLENLWADAKLKHIPNLD